MAISSLALRTTVFTATTTANHVLVLAPATVRPKVLEYSYIQLTAVASQIGVGTPQAGAGTPTNVLFQMDDPGDPASVCNGAIAWSTSPTVPLIFRRRWNGTLASVGVVWTFPRGLVAPASGSYVNWNIATTVASDVNTVLDEQMAEPTQDDRIAYIALSLYGDGAMSISGNIGDQRLALQMLDHAAQTIRERLRVNPYAGLILPPSETDVTPSPQYPALVAEGDLPEPLRARLRTQPLEVTS